MSSGIKAAQPHKIERWMRRREWNRVQHDSHLRGRLHHIALYLQRRGGRPAWVVIVDALTGSTHGGSYDEPSPPTWYYRRLPTRPEPITGYPRRHYAVIKTYDEYRAATAYLPNRDENPDAWYDWSAIGVDGDGKLYLGKMYWDNRTFHGLDYAEIRLLTTYLIRWRLSSWFGLRAWLWRVALHASVKR